MSIPKRLSGRKQPGFQLDDADLLAQLEHKTGSVLWLGRFSASEIDAALERVGILADLRRRGLDDFQVIIEPLVEFGQDLKIYCHSPKPNALLAEARLREVVFQPAERMQESFSRRKSRMLAIEWLMMQNPFAQFTAEKPRLPGQHHPGLGQARRVLKLLQMYCRWQQLAGLLNYPEYYHNAWLYRSYFQFYDPKQQAIIDRLHRDCGSLNLAQRSWAIDWGCVRFADTGDRFEWLAQVQLCPMKQDIDDYFNSGWYTETHRKWVDKFRFELDADSFWARWQNSQAGSQASCRKR